jgi:chloramphenicol-sensitive protein RarD
MIGACLIWGLSPLFYRLLGHVSPADILAQRTIWSVVFFVVVLGLQRRLPALGAALADSRQTLWIVLAALLISVNWFLFIYAIQIDRVTETSLGYYIYPTETSLGYYIYPLVSVLLGMIVFGERLSGVQWLAVGMALVAVLVLTGGLGTAPWISLVLASTFGVYGVLKKRVSTGPVVSVTAEVLVLSPLAFIWLMFFAEALPTDAKTWVLLVLSGPMTAVPLILFSFAAKRVRLATVGLLQYMNPSIQFLLAAVVLSEPMGLSHAVAFPLIWAGLAIYSWSALSQDRAARSAAASAATPGTG